MAFSCWLFETQIKSFGTILTHNLKKKKKKKERGKKKKEKKEGGVWGIVLKIPHLSFFFLYLYKKARTGHSRDWRGGGDILATGFRICLNLPLPITHIDRNLRKNSKREQDPEHSNNATQNKSKINCNANPFALMRIKATSTTAKIE